MSRVASLRRLLALRQSAESVIRNKRASSLFQVTKTEPGTDKTHGYFRQFSSAVHNKYINQNRDLTRNYSTTTSCASSSAAAAAPSSSSSSSALDAALSFSSGQQLHGFTVDRVESVAELALVAVLLRHDETGARFLHLAREDADNTFAVAFR